MNKRARIIDFDKYMSSIEEEKKFAPVVVTFLGFSGHINCMSYIANCANKNGYRHIEASPKDPSEYSILGSFFSKIDAYSMKKSSVHIGLGSIHKQAIAAERHLRKNISCDTPIILCGHSQGGLIAIEFWNKFSKKYNIKGIVTIASPLQGASLFRSLSSYKILKGAARHSLRGKRFSKVILLAIPFLLLPVFKVFSRLLCPSIKDIIPSKKLIKKNLDLYNSLKEGNIPFLNIVATCPAPYSFNNMPFGSVGTKEIVGGGVGAKSDNVLSLTDQKMPIDWLKFDEVHVEADHGLYHVMGYDKIFSHKETLGYIMKFCSKVFNI